MNRKTFASSLASPLYIYRLISWSTTKIFQQLLEGLTEFCTDFDNSQTMNLTGIYVLFEYEIHVF